MTCPHCRSRQTRKLSVATVPPKYSNLSVIIEVDQILSAPLLSLARPVHGAGHESVNLWGQADLRIQQLLASALPNSQQKRSSDRATEYSALVCPHKFTLSFTSHGSPRPVSVTQREQGSNHLRALSVALLKGRVIKLTGLAKYRVTPGERLPCTSPELIPIPGRDVSGAP